MTVNTRKPAGGNGGLSKACLLTGGLPEDINNALSKQSESYASSRPTIVGCLETGRRERMRIALDRYRGENLIDLRVTVDLTASSGIQTPTKKGVSLRVEKLPELIAVLVKAQAIIAARPMANGPGFDDGEI